MSNDDLTKVNLSRRDVLTTAAAAPGALVVGFGMPVRRRDPDEHRERAVGMPLLVETIHRCLLPCVQSDVAHLANVVRRDQEPASGSSGSAEIPGPRRHSPHAAENCS